MNVLIKTKVIVKNLFGLAELMIKTDLKSQNYDLTVFKSSFNYCRIMDGITGDFFFRTLLESLKSTGQELYKCPFLPRTYEYKAIRITDKYVPKFMLLNEVQFKVNFKTRGTLEKSKKNVEISKLQIMGVITKH